MQISGTIQRAFASFYLSPSWIFVNTCNFEEGLTLRHADVVNFEGIWLLWKTSIVCPSVGQFPSLGSQLLPTYIMLGCPCFSHTISHLVACQHYLQWVLLLHSTNTAFKQQQHLMYCLFTQEMLLCVGSRCLHYVIWVWDRCQDCSALWLFLLGQGRW